MAADPQVLVVGASVAGAQVALRLARAGVSTRVLESRTTPRAKVCGEGLHPAGRALLTEVLGDVVDLGVPLRGFEFVDTRPLLHMDHGGGEVGLGCDRLLLEQRLWAALAAAPGVDFRTGVTVRGLGREGAGWLVHGGGTHAAPFVVAADGVHSRIRGWAGRAQRAVAGRWGVRQRFAVDQLPDRVHVCFRGDDEVFVTPLPQGRVSIAVLGSEARVRSLRRAEAFRCSMRDVAVLAGAVPLEAPQVLPHRGANATVAFRDRLYLAGDAAAFLDPISGAGMTMATLSAKVCADAVVAAVAGYPIALVERRAERDFRRVLRPYRQLTRFLLALSRSTILRRSAAGVLSCAPPILSLVSRPTTARWAHRAMSSLASSGA